MDLTWNTLSGFAASTRDVIEQPVLAAGQPASPTSQVDHDHAPQSVAEPFRSEEGHDHSAESDEDDRPPYLASDSISDSDVGHDDGEHSDTNSMPSLQSVSDSSDDDISESEGTIQVRQVQRQGALLGEDVSRDTAAYARFMSADEDGEDEDDEDYDDEDDWIDDEEEILQSQLLPEFDVNLRPQDLLDLLLSPRRQAIDNDPMRAEILLKGLEVVSEELVHRYEKLRSGIEDDNDGCAVCRDAFLQDCLEETPLDKLDKLDDTAQTGALCEQPSSHPASGFILVFPCPGRHLFHRDCLAPWLARKTTCPSCRFDIDPDSLTLNIVSFGSSPPDGRADTLQTRRKWEPPKVAKLEEWLEQEEYARAHGTSARHMSYAPCPIGPQYEDEAHADDEGENEDGRDGSLDNSRTHPFNPHSRESTSVAHSSQSARSSPRRVVGSLSSAPLNTTARTTSPPRPHNSARASQLMALLEANAPSHVSAMDMHDAVYENMLSGVLRLARSHILTGPPTMPLSFTQHQDHGPESDEEPPPLE